MRIVMISDYVNPASYTKKELAEEVEFINILIKEVHAMGNDFDYLEIKTLENLTLLLNKYDKSDTVIFNWCEFLEEKEGTSHLVTGYLESQGFMFTGADTACLQLTDSKEKTKMKLLDYGIPTPKYTVVNKGVDLGNCGLSYPLMLKLEDRHSSAGITNDNVVYNNEQFTKVTTQLINTYRAPVLAEEFIDGQEYTVTVWGNRATTACIYITEELYVNPQLSKINTESAKFMHGSLDEKNVISKELANNNIFSQIEKIVIDSYQTLNFRDYGRFELREKNGHYYIIDCNPNPWLGLDAVLFKGTKKLGYNYGETLLQICKFAVKRYMQ